MPRTDLPQEYKEAPARTAEAQQDRGIVRTGDYTVAADLLTLEKAKGADFVRRVLDLYQKEGEDPIERDKTPTPTNDQPVFLVGEKLASHPLASRRKERGEKLGQWVGAKFLSHVQGATILETNGDLGTRIVVAGFRFPVEELLQAGFRGEDRNTNAFNPSTGAWGAQHNAAHQSTAGGKILSLPGATGDLELAGPYPATESFANHAKWGLFHSEAKKWVLPSLEECLLASSDGVNFNLDGFQLHSQNEEMVQAWVLGFFRQKTYR